MVVHIDSAKMPEYEGSISHLTIQLLRAAARLLLAIRF